MSVDCFPSISIDDDHSCDHRMQQVDDYYLFEYIARQFSLIFLLELCVRSEEKKQGQHKHPQSTLNKSYMRGCYYSA